MYIVQRFAFEEAVNGVTQIEIRSMMLRVTRLLPPVVNTRGDRAGVPGQVLHIF